MRSSDDFKNILIEAATKAIRDIGGVEEFKKLPMFGSNDRRAPAAMKTA